MKVYGVIYLIVNLVNGKMYVGQTIQPLKRRFNDHAKCKTTIIGRAIRKYGRQNFRCEILKCCATKAELDAWEKFFIAVLKTKSPYGYNLTDGGEGVSGRKCSPETSAKIAAARRGEKNPNYGKPMPDEQRAKIAAALTGKKRTPEHCAKLSAAKIGKPLPSETIAKMSLAQSGKNSHNYGKPVAHETSAKISAANRGNSPFKNLLAEFDKHHLSYHRFAEMMDLSYQSISARMRGKLNFTERDKAKLVEIFGKSIDYLLARDKDTNCENVPAPKRQSPYKNLLAELEAHQLTYEALGKLLNIVKSNIARKMCGKRNFTERDKAKLVEIFGKPIEYLLARDE